MFAPYDRNAVDLLKKMLLWDPEERISIEDALKHPYMVDLHYPPDEPTTNPVSSFDFDFELYDLSTEETKELLFEEIMLYHSSSAQKKYIELRKTYPKGMLHTKFGDYREHRKKRKEERKKKREERKKKKEDKDKKKGK